MRQVSDGGRASRPSTADLAAAVDEAAGGGRVAFLFILNIRLTAGRIRVLRSQGQKPRSRKIRIADLRTPSRLFTARGYELQKAAGGSPGWPRFCSSVTIRGNG